jgi:hypothetical protein
MNIYKYNYKSKRMRGDSYPALDQGYISPDLQMYERDKDIQKIIDFTVEDTPEHREWAYWTENQCVSFSRILSSIIFGSGPRPNSENKKAVEIINKFNKKINLTNQTILDFGQNIIHDSLIHGFYCWRIMPTEEMEQKIDISRLNPKTLVPIYHSKKGYMKWVQYARHNELEPDSKKKFDSSSYLPFPNFKTKEYSSHASYKYISIPKDATVSRILFQQPPMSQALLYVVFKRLILFYMRKSAQKYWIPTLIGKYGSEEMLPVINKEQMRLDLKDMAEKLRSLQNFSAVAFPYWTDVQTLEVNRDVKNFVAEIEYLNTEILLSMMGSFVLSSGVIKEPVAATKIRESLFLEVIKNIRAKIAQDLETLWKIVCDYNGVDGSDVECRFPALKEDLNSEIVDMASKIAEQEGFKDGMEYRKFVSQAFPWMAEIDKSDADNMWKERARRFNRKYQIKDKTNNPTEEKKGSSDESSAQ